MSEFLLCICGAYEPKNKGRHFVVVPICLYCLPGQSAVISLITPISSSPPPSSKYFHTRTSDSEKETYCEGTIERLWKLRTVESLPSAPEECLVETLFWTISCRLSEQTSIFKHK